MKKKLESDTGSNPPACSPSSVRAFRVTETGYFEKPTVTIIRTTTPARAKHQVWDSAHSAGYLIEFGSLKVVRAPEYDNAKLKQNWCCSEYFAAATARIERETAQLTLFTENDTDHPTAP